MDERVLRHLSEEATGFPVSTWSGMSERRIKEEGIYEEGALVMNRSDLKLGQYYSAVAVLARDVHDYLATHHRKDAIWFEDLVLTVEAEERPRYGGGAFPRYLGRPTQLLPTGMAQLSAEGRPTLAPLRDPAIVHEWTSKAGWRWIIHFVQKVRRDSRIRQAVCKPGGWSEKLTRGEMGEEEIIPALATAILLKFSPDAFWAPLAVLAASLIVKRGLNLFCAN
jgi:hypothetical protein